MQLVIPRETQPGENRVSATPETVKKLVRLGAEVVVESGAGTGAGISDADYEAAGASIGSDRSALLGNADMVLRLRKPDIDEIGQLKSGCIHVSYLDPFNEKDLIKAFASQNVTAVSMEMIPRSTRSQKMDALSSQANLAGYMAVMLAANNMPSIMPNDDDAGRHAETRQGVHHRRRCCGASGHRHCQASRCAGDSFRYAPCGRRAG